LWIEISDTNATKHTESGLTLSVGHKYISRLVAINGAGLISTYETNGFIIEITPPKVCLKDLNIIIKINFESNNQRKYYHD
jgi:hypothetical protein